MSFYSCIYFESDKSLSTIPQSRRPLRGLFELGREAEVNWGEQTFISLTLKTANKGVCFMFYFMLVYFFCHHVQHRPFLSGQ